MGIIEFIIGRCVLVGSGGFNLLMAHEGVFQGHVVFIVMKIIYFDSSIIDQFLDSSFKGIIVFGQMPPILVVGAKVFVIPPLRFDLWFVGLASDNTISLSTKSICNTLL